MTPLANTIRPMLPALRRYACALTGDQRTGDWYVRIALETLLEEPSRVSENGDVKFELYKLLGAVLSMDGPASIDLNDEADAIVVGSTHSLKQRVLALPILTRRLLLLVALEGFSVKHAAALVEISERAAELHLMRARRQLGESKNMFVAGAVKGHLNDPLYQQISGSISRATAEAA